jgi:hypothetical protein
MYCSKRKGKKKNTFRFIYKQIPNENVLDSKISKKEINQSLGLVIPKILRKTNINQLHILSFLKYDIKTKSSTKI